MTPEESKEIANDISTAISFLLQDRFNIPSFTKDEIQEFLLDPPLGIEPNDSLLNNITSQEFSVIFTAVITALESISYIVWSKVLGRFVPGPLGEGEVINFAFTRGDHHEE